MDFPSLRGALADHFGEDAKIASPEDESEAWRSIVDGRRHGLYLDLQAEIEQLLRCSDPEIREFLRSCAPAWGCDNAGGERYSLEVFYCYLDTYTR